MQESVISFHHVDSRDPTQISGWSTDAFVPTEPSCRPPRSFFFLYVLHVPYELIHVCAHVHGELTLMSFSITLHFIF